MKKISLFALLFLLAGAGCTAEVGSLTVNGTEIISDDNNDDPSVVSGVTDEPSEIDPYATTGVQYDINFTNESTEPSWEAEGFYLDVEEEGEKRVSAVFVMDPPEPGYFYEGWFVCDGKASSTGPTVRDGNFERNIFAAAIEPSCTQYVLTLEPDDDDPAPGEHLFDGTFTESRTVDHLGDGFWFTEDFSY